MSLFSQFETDTSLEKGGILLRYGKTKEGKDICIRVARAGGANDAYMKLMEAKVKPLRRQIQNDRIERVLLDNITKEVFAQTVILGWENVEEKNGTPIAFSKAACIDLFTRLPDLWADVQEQSQNAQLFRIENQEEDAKNS
jgi:hypothetical protein